MNIEHNQEETKGTFFVSKNEARLAELTYSIDKGGLIIEHTEVDDELKGQNVGYQLVKSAVEFARARQLAVIAHCPFAKSLIEKKPDLQ
jgi:uncharacterized protein